MTTRTPIIDSQVHSYERNSPERPWIGSLDGPAEITGDQMVEAMNAVGRRWRAAGFALLPVRL